LMGRFSGLCKKPRLAKMRGPSNLPGGGELPGGRRYEGFVARPSYMKVS
jgi:hypothetical protein